MTHVHSVLLGISCLPAMQVCPTSTSISTINRLSRSESLAVQFFCTYTADSPMTSFCASGVEVVAEAEELQAVSFFAPGFMAMVTHFMDMVTQLMAHMTPAANLMAHMTPGRAQM